ncbi:MAG: cytochrome c [Woeseiaceae bacterium]|nr:cytochrome c [Woeseiaceae bacterium]
MSPMKKSLSLVLGVFAATLVLSGCSRQEAPEEPQVEEPQVEASPAAEPSVDTMSPQEERHELMEGVKDAAQVVGPMLQGKADFDAEAAMDALNVWADVGRKFGDLFPEGTETGYDTEAAPAIWEDREGFNAALKEWQDATAAAIAASPQSLDDARAVIGPAFETCKNCHDDYRIEKED